MTQTLHIGFTGTQRGMNSIQKTLVDRFLEKISDRESCAHHGDCVGADTDFHNLVKTHGFKVVLHPPINTSKRSFSKADEEMPPDEYLKRNLDIAKACDLLIATPKETSEVTRSGTWSTIRYAKKLGKMVIIIYPTGKTEILNKKSL